MSNIWSQMLCRCLADCWPHTLGPARRKLVWDFTLSRVDLTPSHKAGSKHSLVKLNLYFVYFQDVKTSHVQIYITLFQYWALVQAYQAYVVFISSAARRNRTTEVNFLGDHNTTDPVTRQYIRYSTSIEYI